MRTLDTIINENIRKVLKEGKTRVEPYRQELSNVADKIFNIRKKRLEKMNRDVTDILFGEYDINIDCLGCNCCLCGPDEFTDYTGSPNLDASCGVYVPQDNTIYINALIASSKEEILDTLLHEATHFIDVNDNPEVFTPPSYNISKKGGDNASNFYAYVHKIVYYLWNKSEINAWDASVYNDTMFDLHMNTLDGLEKAINNLEKIGVENTQDGNLWMSLSSFLKGSKNFSVSNASKDRENRKNDKKSRNKYLNDIKKHFIGQSRKRLKNVKDRLKNKKNRLG